MTDYTAGALGLTLEDILNVDIRMISLPIGVIFQARDTAG